MNDPIALPTSSTAASHVFHVEHIRSQYEHLLVLEDYHVHLMNTTQDHELFQLYRDVVNSIRNAISQDEKLLAKLKFK